MSMGAGGNRNVDEIPPQTPIDTGDYVEDINEYRQQAQGHIDDDMAELSFEDDDDSESFEDENLMRIPVINASSRYMIYKVFLLPKSHLFVLSFCHCFINYHSLLFVFGVV